MPGEPIDEYSILLNVDAGQAISNMVDAMEEIEQGWDEIIKAANALGDVDLKTFEDALKKIEEAMAGELQSSLLLDRALEKAKETGQKYEAVVVAIADSIRKLNLETTELAAQATAEQVQFDLTGLKKAHELATDLGQVYVDMGRVLPFDELARFEEKLFDVFKTGIKNTRDLNLTFARMEEITEDAKESAAKFADKLEQIDPAILIEVNKQIERVENHFLTAGEAIPFLKVRKLKKELIEIGKEGAAAGLLSESFKTMSMEADKLIGSLDTIKTRLLEVMQVYPPDEVAEGYKIIADTIAEINEHWEEQGRVLPVEAIDKLREGMIRVLEASAKAGDSADVMKQKLVAVGDSALQSFGAVTDKMQIFKDLALQAANAVGSRFGVNVNQVLVKTKGALNLATKAAAGMGIELGALAATAATVALAIAAVLIPLGIFIKLAGEGLRIALQDSEAHQRLALSVRQHQRALGALSPTQQEAIEFAQGLADTFNETRVAMESLVATSLFMTRQFELSTDQTFELAKAAEVLAISAGTSAESALRSITNFMLTGYAEGLQQLGISLSDAELFARAFDLGLVGLGEEMDENAKSMAGLSLILEEAAKAEGDAGDAAQSMAKQLAKMEDRSREAKKALGQVWAPFALAWEGIKTDVVEAVFGFLTGIVEGSIRAVGWLLALVDTMQDLKDTIPEGGLLPDTGDEGMGDFVSRRFTENMEFRQKEAEEIVKGLHEIGDDVKELGDKAAEEAEALRVKIISAATGIRAEMNKLQADFDEKMLRIGQRFKDTMDKIDLSFGRRRVDAAADYNRDIREIDENAQEASVDAVRDHNEDVIRLEEDHKLKMLQIEERYLFELEDAVGERDARGVLMAMRRHNREKKEAERDKGLREKRLKEGFLKELAEIERERIRRRAERMADFVEENDDLALQEARRREDARRARFNAERDLREANNRKLTILAEGFIKEFSMTNVSLNELFGLMNEYLGPGGQLEGLYKYIAQVAASTNLSPSDSLSSQTSGGFKSATDPLVLLTGGYLGGGQRGRTMFATSPGFVRVGEGGVPERIDITPLSQSTGAPRAGFGGAGGQQGAVDINLGIGMEHGLIADIIDQTMDAQANVIVNMTRKQRQQTRR